MLVSKTQRQQAMNGFTLKNSYRMYVQPSVPATWIVQSGAPRPQEEDKFLLQNMNVSDQGKGKGWLNKSLSV